MSINVEHWLKGNKTQNFGDFLSCLLLHRLFLAKALPASSIYIIGSVIDDGVIARNATHDSEPNSMIFWGCGLRDEKGISPAARQRIDIRAVRGPLTRSILELGDSVPVGDPGLLVPSLYSTRATDDLTGRNVLVPHILDSRPDNELRRQSGCDIILRPGIGNELPELERFIDCLVSARFVLTGSLHAAIVRAAYGRPFGFWDSGQIDVPFKWHDFAASVSIPCRFLSTLEVAEAHYQENVKSALTIPPLWPLLTVAPLIVRTDAAIRIIQRDVERHGPSVLVQHVDDRTSSILSKHIQDESTIEEEERRKLDALRAAESQRTSDTVLELTRVRAFVDAQAAELADVREVRDRVCRDLKALEALHGASQRRQDDLLAKYSKLESEAQQRLVALTAIKSSHSWLLTAPLRKVKQTLVAITAIISRHAFKRSRDGASSMQGVCDATCENNGRFLPRDQAEPVKYLMNAALSWGALARSLRLDSKLAVLTIVWPHHAKRSGYHPVAKGLGVELPEHVTLIPAGISQWIAGEGLDAAYQIALAIKIARCDRLLVINGDFNLKLIESIRRLTQARIYAVFHQIPKVLEQLLVGSPPRLVDGAVCVARCQIPLVQSIAPPEKTWFVPHGVDTDFFTPRAFRSARPSVLCVGVHQRDFDTLREAADLIVRAVPTASVRLIAPSAFLPSGLNLGRVELVTDVSDQRLLEEYRRAWVILLPVIDATANNSLLEGMACGTPVVVTDTRGIRDYVGSDCGALCRPGDAQAHSEATIDLLLDSFQREAAGRAARARAEICDWTTVREQIRKILV
jgi:glycosyltransferase involved in cell wall biosynthesis